MKKQSNLVYFVITFLFLTFFDLYLSNFIVHNLTNGVTHSLANSATSSATTSVPIANIGLVNLTYAENTGAAFSILQHSTVFLIILSVIAIIAGIYYGIKHIESLQKKEIICLSLFLAGISGNLCERLYFGFVRDYFNLAFVNFPIFNISDVFINVSVVGIIILILLNKKPNKTL